MIIAIAGSKLVDGLVSPDEVARTELSSFDSSWTGMASGTRFPAIINFKNTP